MLAQILAKITSDRDGDPAVAVNVTTVMTANTAKLPVAAAEGIGTDGARLSARGSRFTGTDHGSRGKGLGARARRSGSALGARRSAHGARARSWNFGSAIAPPDREVGVTRGGETSVLREQLATSGGTP
jgi:hypothetical protein